MFSIAGPLAEPSRSLPPAASTGAPRSSRAIRDARSGSALLTALIGLLLLEAAITGMLYVCMQERLVVGAFTRRSRAQLAARSGVHAALAAWPADSLRALPPGGVHRPAAASEMLPGGAVAEAEIERLRDGWFLVRGAGRPAAERAGGARAAAVVAMFETGTVWRDFGAPLSAGADVAIDEDAVIDGLRGDARPDSWAADECPATINAEAGSVLGTLMRPAVAARPDAVVNVHATSRLDGWPAIARDSMLADAATFDRVGPLSVAQAVALADRIETGIVTPGPVVAGAACVTSAPDNWGDPDDRTSPCADHFPKCSACYLG